jgi:LCP family protein required for cell wall assembly
MTSFLRDTYVQIPGHKNNRINASYQFGGMELLDECIELNFGVHVDANVEVDFNGFISLIDMMGGVTIDLTSSEAKYLNNRGNWGAGNVTESGEEWNLKAGKNKLTGTQALAYSRIRAIGMDFERTERQRKVITAVLNQVKSLSLLELNGLLTHGLSLITTDMTNEEMTNYAFEFIPMLKDLNIVSQRIPFDGTYWSTNIGSEQTPDWVIDANLKKNGEMLRESIGLVEAAAEETK